MVVRMRSTRGHTGNRRSHHALKLKALSKCAKCNVFQLPHRACLNCGSYKSREVVDIMAKANKKDKKKRDKKTDTK